MPLRAIKEVAAGRVSLFAIHRPLGLLTCATEWIGGFHPSMQTPRFPLLRLGWKLEGHEVSIQPKLHMQQKAQVPFSAFLKSPLLATFSKAHPQIEIHISPRPHRHPVVRGHYINGKEKSICVRNLAKEQILQKAELLMESTGDRNRKIRGKNVVSTNESVRGIWSPHHAQLSSV